jgi:3-oxoacyl-[acyl-carrier protein] reductase
VPREQVVRLHASSGTTGKPTVVGYTAQDIDTWSNLVARSIRAAGGRCLGIGCDVTDTDQVEAAIDRTVNEFGRLDILVNNAGVNSPTRAATDTSDEEWDRVMDINARGTLFAMQHAARAMIAQGSGGTIVNIASMAAKAGGNDEGAYAASKGAVVALTRAAALEWGEHHIRVNSLLPGYVLTEMGADTRTEEDVANWSKKSPLGRLGTPDDVAGFALFLASADGAYLTGQAFNVTGGMIMH